MGVHKKPHGIALIRFFKALGGILSYYVKEESPMFEGDQHSPDIDVTWRRVEDDKFPLFIFEVESIAAKSASDNALKVFSSPVDTFQKPLFFYHVFVEDPTESGRIARLKNHFGEHNYDTYLLSKDTDPLRLLRDVLEQHFRINAQLDLYSLVALLENENTLPVTGVQLLAKLVEDGYDRRANAHFLSTLERLISDGANQPVRDFYQIYLSRYLAYESQPPQSYTYLSAASYGNFTHWALELLMSDAPDYDRAFDALVKLEQAFKPFPM